MSFGDTVFCPDVKRTNQNGGRAGASEVGVEAEIQRFEALDRYSFAEGDYSRHGA